MKRNPISHVSIASFQRHCRTAQEQQKDAVIERKTRESASKKRTKVDAPGKKVNAPGGKTKATIASYAVAAKMNPSDNQAHIQGKARVYSMDWPRWAVAGEANAIVRAGKAAVWQKKAEVRREIEEIAKQVLDAMDETLLPDID